jgi:ABC-2 type transport system permease protein
VKEIIALARKDLLLLFRDRGGFFFAFFFPLVMAVFFGTIFSGGGDETRALSVLLVDEDSTAGSAEFIRTLAASEELRVEQTTRDSAVGKVRTGKRVAYIVIKKGFGEARGRMFWGDPPAVEVGVDPSRKAESGMIQGILMKYAAAAMQKTFSDRSAMRDMVGRSLDSLRAPGSRDFPGKENLSRFLGEFDRFVADTTLDSAGRGASRGFEPLHIEEAAVIREESGPANAYAVSFPQGIIWGMVGCAAAFGISLVLERTRGTLIRLRIAPITRMQILAGKALACFVATVLISVILLVIGTLFFGVRPSSSVHLAMAVLCSSIAFVGIMMLLSVLGKTERSAGGVGWAALLLMSMIGGGMIPLFIMPAWMQTASNISPVKWSVLALEGALWRNFSFAEMLTPCGILLAVGVAAFAVGVKIFRWTQQS